MADQTITFSKSIVAQKDISEGGNTAYITQLSKPIILKGVSTKTCPNVLYSIDGMNFTEETNIGDGFVLSMAIVPFQLGGADIGSYTSSQISPSMIIKAFSYILGGRDINEELNIDLPISYVIRNNRSDDACGAYRYLLQYLEKNQDKIEWDTGDLFNVFNAEGQDLFGGSDFITDKISVNYEFTYYGLAIDKQKDANGSILKPSIITPDGNHRSSNTIKIRQSPYFFLYPEGCPASDGDPDKLIIDNFWRGGGVLVSKQDYGTIQYFYLFIFAVTQTQ